MMVLGFGTVLGAEALRSSLPEPRHGSVAPATKSVARGSHPAARAAAAPALGAAASEPEGGWREHEGGGREFVGFDRNNYPGDAALPVLRRHFAFAGYWLNAPPGERVNSWAGRREALVRAGFGFLLLWNGRLDAEILKAQKAGIRAEALGAKDGAAAVAAAKAERFPFAPAGKLAGDPVRAGATIFVDQEEGGRMLPEQAGYLRGWAEAVARGGYRPGVYGSGQPVPDGPGKTITTMEDLRAKIGAGEMHEVAMWVYQDGCPPSNGCVLAAPALGASGTPGAEVWQYAQSPRRPEITRACAKTYRPDGNCELPELPGVHLDLSVAASADPSGGR